MEFNDNPRINFKKHSDLILNKNINANPELVSLKDRSNVYDRLSQPARESCNHNENAQNLNRRTMFYTYRQTSKLNRLAVIAFLFGISQIILFPFFFFAIPTIILSNIAFIQIKLRNQSGIGLTLAAMILGYMGGLFDLIMIGSLVPIAYLNN